MHPNSDPSIADFWLIRHAPSVDGGAMAGRRDVAADCSNAPALAALRAKVNLGAADRFWVSPAQRCLQTAAALSPLPAQPDPRLWEQDFGAWEGRAYADLPDLGPLGRAELAAFAPPMGESFADLSARVWPALRAAEAGRHVMVTHAGVIRAALGLALGDMPLGLAFSAAPLSLTRVSRDLRSDTWAVHLVNWTEG